MSEPYPSGLSRGDFKIDVRFDDTGTVREGVVVRYFIGGYVRDGSVEIPKGIGGMYNTFESGIAEIISYEHTHDLTVKFLNTGNTQAAQLDALVTGVVKDRKLFSDLAAKNLEEENRARAEREEAYAKIKAEKEKEAAEKTAKWEKYLAECKAKRDSEEEKSRILQAALDARRAEKIANLDKALEIESKALDQEKDLKGVLPIDFKDRDGKWVLRFAINGEFVQTRLGKLHNNLTQRVNESCDRSKFYKAYEGVEISDSFKDAQRFCDWAVQQKGWGLGYQLDKDLLSGDCKIYSEDTCVFLPREINFALATTKKNHAKVGGDGYYTLNIRLSGKEIMVPGFESADSALDAYRKYREAYVRKLATEYREVISEEAYEALMVWRLKVSE